MSKVLTDQIEKRTGGTAIDLPATGKWPQGNIADDAIGAAQIATNAVTADAIAADAVTTAEILDNNVTLAKMADGTQGDTLYYGAAGAPTLLAKPGTPADEVLTFATGATAPSWAAAAAGGNTHASQWSLTADFTGDATPIVNNLEEVNAPAGYGKLPASGGSMTLDTGAFAFPVTGTWWVEFTTYVENSNYKRQNLYVTTTTDNSTYADAVVGAHMMAISAGFGVCKLTFLFNVDNITNCKCKFNVVQEGATVTTKGDTDKNETYMTFIRLGDST